MTFHYLRNPDTTYMEIHHERSAAQPLSDIKDVHNSCVRTKAFNCLYRAIKLMDTAEHGSMEKVLQEMVDIMPDGWQFSAIAYARILIDDRVFQSKRYVQNRWMVSTDIFVNKEKTGTIEIGYTEMRPNCFKGPFLEEEVLLLDALSSLIGQILWRNKLSEEKVKTCRNVKGSYENIISGFIPICASCKNIRDEKGIWHQLEAYVQKRANVTFSHGICPKCMKKYI